MPQNREDWPALVYRTNPRPPEGDPLDPTVQRAFEKYVLQLGPFDLSHVRQLSAAVADAHAENDYSPAGPQRCVVGTGQPHSGKTYTALTTAFEETRAAWQNGRVGQDGHLKIPWVYAEVVHGAGAKSLLTAIADFIGLPHGPRTNASAIAEQIRATAPLIGLRGIIIDDAHGILGSASARHRESSALANTLKNVVTGVPATTVILGVDIEASGLLDNVFGAQIRQRATVVRVGNWGPPGPKLREDPWTDLVVRFRAMDIFPDRSKDVLLNTRDALNKLAAGADGSPGTAIRWLKRAAITAIRENSDLDVQVLERCR